ncbi:MAG: RsmE family RNA methyltransferase [Planctomycetota bacterium]|nr:RsmE family RNA methyltransferase [Planctomycetota bacterium]
MNRFFFVDKLPDLNAGNWEPPVELSRHIRALRLKAGAELTLLPHFGDGVTAQLMENGQLLIKNSISRPVLELPDISLATAWPKGNRGDELVRRATELGANRIVPISCQRSVFGRNDISRNKFDRWHKITKEVCQQCRRPNLPIIDSDVQNINQLPHLFGDHQLILLKPNAPLLANVINGINKALLLVIGPEGGLTTSEEDYLLEHGALAAGIGPTILRTEAAGPTAVAIASHALSL